MLHPGFDARLCYGDITLGFQWLPDQDHSSLMEDSASSDEQQQHQVIVIGKQNGKQQVEADGKRGGKKSADAAPE